MSERVDIRTTHTSGMLTHNEGHHTPSGKRKSSEGLPQSAQERVGRLAGEPGQAREAPAGVGRSPQLRCRQIHNHSHLRLTNGPLQAGPLPLGDGVGGGRSSSIALRLPLARAGVGTSDERAQGTGGGFGPKALACGPKGQDPTPTPTPLDQKGRAATPPPPGPHSHLSLWTKRAGPQPPPPPGSTRSPRRWCAEGPLRAGAALACDGFGRLLMRDFYDKAWFLIDFLTI